jgi:large conductance mechanosensitive channel
MAEDKSKDDKQTHKKNVGLKAARAGARQVNGFLDFVRSQGVIGLAVGLAIGTAAGASVKVIVDQFVSPLVALITQGYDLNNLKIVLKQATNTHPEVAIGWGAIVSSLITLVATALVVYLAIHLAKLDRLDKKKTN